MISFIMQVMEPIATGVGCWPFSPIEQPWRIMRTIQELLNSLIDLLACPRRHLILRICEAGVDGEAVLNAGHSPYP